MSAFVNLVAAVAIAVGVGVAVWWLIALFCMHGRQEESELPQTEVPDGIREVHTGIPLALWIFYSMTAIALVGYVLGIWLGGATY